jgi:hypothetical protein
MSAGAQIAILSGLAVALTALAVWIALRVHGTPEKRERRRRLAIHQQGRLAEALITEADDGTLYYSYSVGGVYYTASQDVSALGHLLPGDRNRLVGVSSLKYSPRNPANSILLCEEWSGLRVSVVARASAGVLKDDESSVTG